jgi:PAS domain S-box-containing protein
MKLMVDQLLLDQNPDAVITTTPTGDVMYWNNGAKSNSGFARSKMIGQSPNNSIIPDDHLIS